MTHGSVTLNGLTDKQLVTVLETKIRHEGKLLFNPQQMQLTQTNPQTPNLTINNNVVVSWQNDEGFRAAIALQADLSGHKISAKEAA